MPVVDWPATANREPVRNASVQCHKSRSDYRQPVSIFWPRGRYWHRYLQYLRQRVEYRKKQVTGTQTKVDATLLSLDI